MLPAFYNIMVRNDGGVTATVTAKVRPKRIGAGGIPAFGTEVTHVSAASVASAAVVRSAGMSPNATYIDNTSSGYTMADVTLTVNPGSTPTGNQKWRLFLEGSNDGTTFGTQEARPIGVLSLTATGAISENYEIK